jgi:hypothetical protein
MKSGNAEEALSAAYHRRREILGDDYVDAQVAAANPAVHRFQDYVTSVAWQYGPATASLPGTAACW